MYMPAICRVGDLALTGHLCSLVTKIATSNTDGTVFANNKKVIVNGAKTQIHLVPIPFTDICIPHTDKLNEGSPNVFVNGIGVGRVGDRVELLGRMLEGSPDVFVNGG